MTQVEKNVKIKLNSTISPHNGEEERYEMWLNGSFIEKSGKLYLRYDEIIEDKTIHTTVKMANEQALILRGGDVKMRLPFNTFQKERGHYDTQYGTIPLIVKTHKLKHEHNKDGIINGTFKTQYDLIISGQSVGKYTLEIHYSEGQKWVQ